MSSETITRNDIVAILNKTIPGQGTDMSAQGVEDFIEDLNLAPSDYVKLSELSDYVIEQGTDGNWTYRKWNSGIAECWGTTRFSNVPLTAQWGNGYYSSSVGRSITLPSSLFTSVSSVTSGTDMHGGIGGWCYEGYSTSSVGGYLWSTASEASRIAIDVSLHVKGTWK